jgi:tRNA(Ile)-lysidine synthase
VPTRDQRKPDASLPLDISLLRPGLRLAVGLSGGADSVALLRALAARSAELGLVLHVAHLHHGLRGAEADGDLEFCRALAAKLGVPFHEARVDVAAEVGANPETGKAAESIEEAARRLRYAWFRELMAAGEVDAVATAHTLDDQAETVLAKFLRGAWTEGLAGIAPKLETAEAGGCIVRPLLAVTRAEIEAYLRALGQDWREDSTNRHMSFTRNRIRHELLPLLERWNPQLRQHLTQLATLARDEEVWWTGELARLAPQLLLLGKPVRGGGRAAGEGQGAGLALDVTRLAALPVAMQRRLLRHAAEQLGASLDFPATEGLRLLALNGRSGQKCELARGLRGERSPRELRLTRTPAPDGEGPAGSVPEYSTRVPGEIEAPAFGLRLRIGVSSQASETVSKEDFGPHAETDGEIAESGPSATLRTWMPGDRVKVRHSGGTRKIKEVLKRLQVTGSSRAIWPVLELSGRIIWMRGVELEAEPGITVVAEPLDGEDANLSEHRT